MDIQSLIDMCTKKLDQEPNHKKALLLRASSYIKKNELERVKFALFIFKGCIRCTKFDKQS
jgi:hypothetical protein